MGIFNCKHVSRHTLAAHITGEDVPVSVLHRRNRAAKVIEKDGAIFIRVEDQRGLPVTQFRRRDNQGGLVGALNYLKRVGYE